MSDIAEDDTENMNKMDTEELPSDDSEENMNEKDNDDIVEDDNNGDENDKEDEDDDDDDDDDDDNEDKLIAKYIEILGNLKENKYNYDEYTSLIDTAYELDCLDKIRESFELFSSVYPLSPDIWNRWLEIELNIAVLEEEFDNIDKLFKRALRDYFSNKIASEYGKFALKYSKGNQIWDEILQVYTLHCLEGRKLFEAWRKNYILKTPETPEKLQKLTKMYKKELEIPLLDMEETYIEFKLFCEKNKDTLTNIDWETINRRYNRAKGVLQKILPFENQLLMLDTKNHQERAAIYRKYIKECGHELDGDIVQVLYERMATECCLNPTIWLDYVKYVQKYGDTSESETISWIFRQTDLDVIDKALRNCAWSAELYIEKMRSLELNGSTEKEIQNVLEIACLAGFETPGPLVKIWLEYLTFLYRNSKREEKDPSIIRANFKLCWDNLGATWGALADCNCEILQFWGRLEYENFNELIKGRDLWLTVMESSDNSTKSGLWIEFAQLEMLRGKAAAREIFKKALQSQELDNPYVITSAWIRFERCNGTVDTLKICQEICRNYLQTYEAIQLKTVGSTNFKPRPKETKEREKNKDTDNKLFKKPFDNQTKTKVESTKSLKRSIDQTEELDLSKRMKFDENTNDIDPTKDHLTVFVSNLDYNITEEEVRKLFSKLNVKNVHLIMNPLGRGRGFGYVEFDSEMEAKKAYELDRTPLNGRPTYISSCLRDKSQREKFKYSDSLEPSKLFVKGVSYDATKDDLEKLFGEYGPLKDVRIVCHKNGNSKGIAYIEYEAAESAKRAILKLDQFVYKKQTMSVAISAPPPRNNPSTSSRSLIASLGGSRKPVIRGEAKPRLSFIPQSVQKKALEAAAGILPKDESVVKKTNEDFRKLLNKN